MARGIADIVQVVVLAAGADALLRGRGARARAGLLDAGEDVLERHHAGIDEQQRRGRSAGPAGPRARRRGRPSAKKSRKWVGSRWMARFRLGARGGREDGLARLLRRPAAPKRRLPYPHRKRRSNQPPRHKRLAHLISGAGASGPARRFHRRAGGRGGRRPGVDRAEPSSASSSAGRADQQLFLDASLARRGRAFSISGGDVGVVLQELARRCRGPGRCGWLS